MKINVNDHNDLELALMVLLDYFGNGEARKKALGSKYYDVQAYVNTILQKGIMPKSPSPITNGYTKDQIKAALEKLEPDHTDYNNYIETILKTL